MRKKLLALMLVVAVFAACMVPSLVLPTGAATESTDLFTNGDFSEVDGDMPVGWTLAGNNGQSVAAGITGVVDTTDKSPEGSNSFKVTGTDMAARSTYFYNTDTVSVKPNSNYELSLWIKSSNLKSISFALYEPDYVPGPGSPDLSGEPTAHQDYPSDGTNIYTYSYKNNPQTTRTVREHINHTFKLGNMTVAAGASSMAILRGTGDAPLEIPVDDTSVNGWTKLTYTFSTSDAATDAAEVRFALILGYYANTGENTASFADFRFEETSKPFAFTPQSNDGNLGTTFPKSGDIPLSTGEGELSFMAMPVGGNTFEKWQINGVDVPGAEGTNPVIKRTFKTTDVLTAVFKTPSGNIVQNSGAEGLPDGVFMDNSNDAAIPGQFMNIEGTQGFARPDDGSTFNVSVTSADAHSGEKSYILNMRYQVAARDITGLKKNTDYILSMWVKLTSSTSKLDFVNVMGKETKDEIWKDGTVEASNLYQIVADTSLGSIRSVSYPNSAIAGTNSDWQRVAVKFNTGDNDAITMFLKFDDENTAARCYLDDIGLEEIDNGNDAAMVTSLYEQGGTATNSAGLGAVPKGSRVAFYATPIENVNFLGWFAEGSDTPASTDRMYVMTVDQDTTLTAKFETVNVGVESVGLGGTATSDKDGIYPKGEVVTFTATPYQGNTFVGWYSAADNSLVSEDATFVVTCETDMRLMAVFDGPNMPPAERLGFNGFEDIALGTNLGAVDSNIWSFTGNDPEWGGGDWITFTASNVRAYEGAQSLQLTGRYRNNSMSMYGLNKNSNYKISFVYKMIGQEDSEGKLVRTWVGPVGTIDPPTDSATLTYISEAPLYGGRGWQKVEIYFNSGDATSLDFGIRFEADDPGDLPYGADQDRLYIDNLELWEYGSNETLLNGDFSDESEGWAIADGNYTTDNGEGNITGDGATLSQIVDVDPFSQYILTFKAKVTEGSVLDAGILELEKDKVTAKNLISSIASERIEGTDYANYTIMFTTGKQEAIKLAFTNTGSGTSIVDDVKLSVDAEGEGGGIIEKVDFETDRFTVSDFVNADSLYEHAAEPPKQSEGFEIYTATGANDPYVHSGTKSLKIKASSDAIASRLWQVWSSFPAQKGGTYRVELYYKFATKAGGVYISPDATGTYAEETDYMAEDTEWHRLRFSISNSQSFDYIRLVVGSMEYMSESDVYIDDIVFQLAPAAVTDEAPRTLYTENLYNAVKNPSFESNPTANDWGSFPSAYKIVTGTASKPAFTQNKYLAAGKTNEKYLLRVSVKAGSEYFLGVSIRGTVGSKSYVGLATNENGSQFFYNSDDQIASQLRYTRTDGQWQRTGIKIVTPASGYVTLVIDTSDGALDIDNVMIFSTDHKYTYDPNDYYNYQPYNFNDLSKAIINGGLGAQPYYEGNLNEPYGPENMSYVDTGEGPGMGDKSALTYLMLVFSLMASAGAVFYLIVTNKKDKEVK